MQIGMTIQQRIEQAEALPRSGTLQEMVMFQGIRHSLVGCFSEQQLINYRIVEYEGRLITNCPSTRVAVTLSDEQVLAYADFINKRSQDGMIRMEDSAIYATIVAEAERVESERVQEEDGE